MKFPSEPQNTDFKQRRPESHHADRDGAVTPPVLDTLLMTSLQTGAAVTHTQRLCPRVEKPNKASPSTPPENNESNQKKTQTSRAEP